MALGWQNVAMPAAGGVSIITPPQLLKAIEPSPFVLDRIHPPQAIPTSVNATKTRGFTVSER